LPDLLQKKDIIMATKTKNNVEIIPPKNIFAGNTDAPVTLTMFGDYEDETCAKANEVINILMKEFEGKLRFSFRHFPQTHIHQKAMKAAEACLAAAQEGRFWDMHNILFQRRRQLGTISLQVYAKEIGITNKRFLDELVNSKYSWHIRGDQIQAWEMGIRSIPVFFINGERIETTPTYENLKKAIQGTSKKSQKKKTSGTL
jgi:protein-disulfide isomerase